MLQSLFFVGKSVYSTMICEVSCYPRVYSGLIHESAPHPYESYTEFNFCDQHKGEREGTASHVVSLEQLRSASENLHKNPRNLRSSQSSSGRMIENSFSPFLVHSGCPRSRLQLFISLFFLLALPRNAMWYPENYCDSTGTRHSPISFVDSRQWRAKTKDFISREALHEFSVQMNNSWDRLGGVDHSKTNDVQFPNEIDAIFRIHRDIDSSKSVLDDGIRNGLRINQQLTTIRKITVNEPFVESIPSSASSIREFVNSVTNNTSRPGDSYYWAGGYISDFNLTRSRVQTIQAECNELVIVYREKEKNEDGEHKVIKKENITWIIRVSDTYNYYVYIYPAEHGSPLCADGGDSLFLKEHGDLSQRLMRSTSDHLAVTTQGTIFPEQLNSGNLGNLAPKLHFVNSTSTGNSPYFFDIQKALSNYYGTQKLGERRTLWLQAEEAFEQSLAAYDNFGFLLLSITALVSSTIIAIVTVKKASKGEFAVVIVEGLVVLLFFIVLTHALVVYSRAQDFVVDYEVRQSTISFYEDDVDYDIMVLGYFQFREALIGKRHKVPGMLVSAEVCAIIAFIIVFGNIIRLSWNRQKAKAAPVWITQGNTTPAA